MFRHSDFGHFRKISEHFNRFNGMLVHCMVLHHVVEKKKREMCRTREERVLKKQAAFCAKVRQNKKISAEKLLVVVRGPKLTKEEKLKCCLVWFVHTILLAKDMSKGVDHDLIKMADDLELFKSYPWGKESFELTLDYLKNKIDIPKHHQVHVEKRPTSYSLYGFPWVWAYEDFPALGRNAGKSEEVSFSIPRILRWHTKKME
ncbi:uncharacterized protein LOC132631419 [Lycium barbarum]|uniref:uncharacterized protein LOC132631419 n=1 Tax=Lycium barbarum TaxID=112863 RepID=UPI00293EE9CB|nr:uncharacterized protein LOC132631419 [Lycium barbarum]